MTLPDPTPSRPEPEVVRVLREFRAGIIGMETEQAEALARQWLEIERRLSGDILALIADLQGRDSSDPVTAQLLRRLDRYQSLQRQMAQEISQFTRRAAIPSIEQAQLEYAQFGARASQQAIIASYVTRIAPNFNRLPARALNAYVGLLGDGTPLNRLLKEAYPLASESVTKALLQGLAMGYNPNQIAQDINRALGVGLDRILLIARTEQLRAYRTASTEQYRVSGVVTGFRRLATKDDRTCIACLMSDGEFFKVESELSDHPRGRCAAVPICVDAPAPEWQTGKEWFEFQPEETQRAMLGPEKYELWQAGAFSLDDLRRTASSPVWGDSPRVATIKELTE